MRTRSILGTTAAFLLVAAGARADDASGEQLWKTKCATCHGADGKAGTAMATKMGIAPFDAAWGAAHTDAQIRATISDGLKREQNGKQQQMMAFKEKLTAQEIDSLVAHVRSFAPAAAAPKKVEAPKAEEKPAAKADAPKQEKKVEAKAEAPKSTDKAKTAVVTKTAAKHTAAKHAATTKSKCKSVSKQSTRKPSAPASADATK